MILNGAAHDPTLNELYSTDAGIGPHTMNNPLSDKGGFSSEAMMIPCRMKPRHLLLISLLLSTSLILPACANKAKLIQAGATQFEVESLAAIERID